MHSKGSQGNPNPNRPMLAFHFLRALGRIHQRRARQSSPSVRAAIRCSRRIRRVAYASMALAAGRRRVWSRAVLHNLRTRARALAPADRRGATIGRKTGATSRRPGENTINWSCQEDELRRLVPGGRRMDDCSLLEETGNYIQCLQAQVLLMQRIADSISGL